MSLELNSDPVREVFCLPAPINGERVIMFNGVDIPMSALSGMVMYAMCQMPLVDGDARLQLLEEFRTLRNETVDGQVRLISSGQMGAQYSRW